MNKENILLGATIVLVLVTGYLGYVTKQLYGETIQLRQVTESYAASFKDTGQVLAGATEDIKKSTASLPDIKDSLDNIYKEAGNVDSRLKDANDAIASLQKDITDIKTATTTVQPDVAAMKKDVSGLKSNSDLFIQMKFQGKW
jgi:peptidoglycan hydrolase CwlO-like protein